MAKFPKCGPDRLPVVRIGFERQVCLRGKGPVVTSPKDVMEFVKTHFGCSPQERILTLLVNARNEIMGVHEVNVGAIDQSMADPRLLFGGVLTAAVPAFILVHNHPSGSTEPSAADIELTKKLSEGAKLLSLRFLDHVIVSHNGVHSMRTHGPASLFADVFPP